METHRFKKLMIDTISGSSKIPAILENEIPIARRWARDLHCMVAASARSFACEIFGCS